MVAIDLFRSAFLSPIFDVQAVTVNTETVSTKAKKLLIFFIEYPFTQ